MRFEDLPLRNVRDRAFQDACRIIRRTLLKMPVHYVDFISAFTSMGNDGRSLSKVKPSSAEVESVRLVFNNIADMHKLTPGERLVVIGILLQEKGSELMHTEIEQEK